MAEQLDFRAMAIHYEERELAYLAGFFDGEGNIDIAHAKRTASHPSEQYSLNVIVSQKDLTMLKAYKIFGGSIYHDSQDCYQWHIHGYKASHFLKAILPYLRLKKDQAVKAIEFQKLVRPPRGHISPISPSLLTKQAKLYQEFRLIKSHYFEETRQ